MNKKSVYSIKFTHYMNFVVAETHIEAIKIAKKQFLKRPIDFDKFKIEIASEER